MALRKRLTLTVSRLLRQREICWDTDVKGFGVKGTSEGATFFLKTRIAGRQRWITIGRLGSPWTVETARKRAIELLAEAVRGNDVGQELREQRRVMALGEAADRFKAEHLPKLKPTTQRLYGEILDRLIIPRFASRRLQEIGTDEIGKFHADLLSTPRQANTALTVLSSLLGWAMDLKLMPRRDNPCEHVRRYRENARKRYLSLEELDRLATALAAIEDADPTQVYGIAAIRLLILTGARYSEIMSLEWSFVSLDSATLTLPDSKTGSKSINLSEETIEVLRRIPRRADNTHVIVGGRRGEHMKNLYVLWDEVRRRAGLTDIRLHDLRHTYASFAIRSGGSLPLIGKLLGHANTQTTSRYAHIADEQTRRLTRDVGTILGGVVLRRS